MQIIVAVDSHWGIGKDNNLLFHIPKDLQYFKEKTLGKVVVMGRKTLQSLPKGQPLKERVNLVLSQTLKAVEGAIVVTNMRQLFQQLKQYDSENIFIIGGATVYKELLPYCSYAFVTKIFADGQATEFFENLDCLQSWEAIEKADIQEENGYCFQFCRYKNNKVKNFE